MVDNGLTGGILLGLSLIMAIWAQNAFVLRQGLQRKHVLAVCLVCAVSDTVLIAVGVTSFSAVVGVAPWLGPLMRYGSAAFLLIWLAQLSRGIADPGCEPARGLDADRRAISLKSL